MATLKTQKEIEDLISRAADAKDEGGLYPGMSYEDGIDAALRWVLGEEGDPLD